MVTLNGSTSQAVSLLVPFAGLAIAWSVYRLSKVQRDEAWLRNLWEFQRVFWLDDRMEMVRSWIACDAAYEQLRPILMKRRQYADGERTEDSHISTDEYKHLETLDRFAALLLGYRKIAPNDYGRHGEVMYRIFDDYWIRQISEGSRPDLYWYLKNFYPELFGSISLKCE